MQSTMHKPPIFNPIKPIPISNRWFPKRRSFGLYESKGKVAPNVTSILGWKFPFDKSKWIEVEPDIDHDAVTRESAERGTAVHCQRCWNWSRLRRLVTALKVPAAITDPA